MKIILSQKEITTSTDAVVLLISMLEDSGVEIPPTPSGKYWKDDLHESIESFMNENHEFVLDIPETDVMLVNKCYMAALEEIKPFIPSLSLAVRAIAALYQTTNHIAKAIKSSVKKVIADHVQERNKAFDDDIAANKGTNENKITG